MKLADEPCPKCGDGTLEHNDHPRWNWRCQQCGRLYAQADLDAVRQKAKKRRLGHEARLAHFEDAHRKVPPGGADVTGKAKKRAKGKRHDPGQIGTPGEAEKRQVKQIGNAKKRVVSVSAPDASHAEIDAAMRPLLENPSQTLDEISKSAYTAACIPLSKRQS